MTLWRSLNGEPRFAREMPIDEHTLDNFKTQNWAIIKTAA